MGLIPKQLMEIGSGDNSIVTDAAYAIAIEADMDNLALTMTFMLPYIQYSDSDVDLTKLKKKDTVKLYFKEFDEEPGTITTNDLVKVFDGYINNIKLSKNKNDESYNITAYGTLALSNEQFVEHKVEQVTEQGGEGSFINILLQKAGLQTGPYAIYSGRNIIPIENIRFYDTDVEGLFIKINGGENLKEILDDIKSRYAIIIHQSGDGIVNVMTPYFLVQNNSDILPNAWEFNLSENIWSLDYGDVVDNINAVVVYGIPGIVGYAIDPVAVQLTAGVDTIPSIKDYNYISFENRSLTSTEDCETVARNKLLEIIRNYFVTFKTDFNPEFMVGQPITITDGDRYDNQFFIIKRLAVTIEKDDVSCEITAFANSITLFPEEIVTESTGIADVDLLNIPKEVDDELGWNRAVE